MNNVLIDSNWVLNDRIIIEDEKVLHHLLDVMRVSSGKRLKLTDGRGIVYEGTIISLKEKRVEVSIEDMFCGGEESKLFRLTLFQGMPKAGKLETIIQKVVELGCIQIVPIYMDRSISVDKGKGDKKKERWQKIATETIKQCGGTLIPAVEAPITFEKCLDKLETMDHVIFPHESMDGRSIKDFLREIKGEIEDKASNSYPINIGIIIGPEGGFSPREKQELISRNIEPLSLGSRILRTETAAISTVCMALYELEL